MRRKGNETGSYYLKNRQYFPQWRKFLTRDPRGVDPVGNWNNPFDPLSQYADGFGLETYAGHNPVMFRDDWGLWQYAKSARERAKESRTFVVADGVSQWKFDILGLARLVRLNEEEFDRWGRRTVEKVNGVKKCGARVANTAYVNKQDILQGVAGSFNGKGANTDDENISTKKHNIKDLYLDYFLDIDMRNIAKLYSGYGYKVKYEPHASGNEQILSQFSNPDIVAWAYGGHGYKGVLYTNTYGGEYDEVFAPGDISNPHHKLADITLYYCEALQNKNMTNQWKTLLSRYGVIRGSALKIYPMIEGWRDLDEIKGGVK